jgi:hypothetical protein
LDQVPQPISFLAVIVSLGRNQLRESIRHFRHQPNPVAWALLGVFGLLMAFALVTAGLRFHRITILLGVHVPVALFNDYLLSVFISLFGIRFLFQRSPRFRLQPYLHLPLQRWHLVAYFQFSSLFTIHNLYPLLFLLPFWSQFILPAYTIAGALYWLIAILLSLGISTLLNNWIRSVLTNSELVFIFLAILVWLLVAADTVLSTFLVNDFSTFLFAGLGDSDAVLLLLVAATAIFTLVLSSFSLYNSLVASSYRSVSRRRAWITFDRLFGAGPVGALIQLEMKMMWRNKRPRHYLIMSVLFSTAYLLFLLINPATSRGAIFGAIIGLFASGGFALNYGQLMFAWESTFFDGLLVRHEKVSDIVKAKLILLQTSCAILFLFSVPVFALLRPELVPLHVAFLMYNVGITCVLIMLLAIRNRKRVDIQKGGSFFNYEGFSAAHWFWLLPVAVPPTILLYLLDDKLNVALLVISIVGGISMMCSHLWVDYFSDRLSRKRYEMARGFRTHAS